MCGIFGIIKTKGPSLTDGQRAEWSRLMGSLATLSTSRGMDSAGFMRVTADGAVETAKDAVPAWEFLARPEWASVATPSDGTLATIGHTRMATHGAVTQANAHPFVFSNEDGDVTAGVHNGVINNHARFAIGGKVYAVDSANLIAGLASARVRDWRTLLRQAEGSLALALVRSHGGKATVFLTRRGNPLWVAHVSELNALAFASTKDILAQAVRLSRLHAVGAREISEGLMYAYEAKGAVREGPRWWQAPKPKAGKKAKGGKGGATVWVAKGGEWVKKDETTFGQAAMGLHSDEPSIDEVFAPTGPGKALGSNGKEYVRCGSCLDWRPPEEMDYNQANGAVLCPNCSQAAKSWRRPWASHAAHRAHKGGAKAAK